jgi:hypothetical protein
VDAHRLLPPTQPPTIHVAADWADKWRVIDDSFEIMVNSLTVQLGKKIGAVILELVKTKFPFDPKDAFPL